MTGAPSFHPYQAFLDAVPVDVVGRSREARLFARVEIRIEKRVFGERRSALHGIVRKAFQHASDRERIIAGRTASVAYQSSMDPVTREVRQIELRMEILRDRVLGKVGYARDRNYAEMNRLAQRLLDLQPAEMLEAAE